MRKKIGSARFLFVDCAYPNWRNVLYDGSNRYNGHYRRTDDYRSESGAFNPIGGADSAYAANQGFD